MSDKDFKVKNKLVVKGITSAGPITSDAAGNIDSVPHIATQFGGTGTATSPSSGQVLYSSSGTTYAPTTLNTLDVKGASYSADAPSSPVVGQIWVESDTSSDSFDPNIIRRKTFTATAAQTVFTTDLEFIQGYEQVFFNGMLLIRNSDYTTASNTNVTLAAGAAAGDIVEVVSITNLNSINTVATTGANTITSTTASTIPLTIQGAASQSAKLLDMKNNSGSSIAYFGPNGALSNTGVSLSSYGQVACQSTDTGISISGGTGYPNGGTIVYRGNNGNAGGTAGNGLEFLAGGTERMRLDSTGKLTFNTTAYGRINPGTVSYDFVNAGAWLGGSIVTSGSYGGPISMLDGSAGWNIRLQDSGANMRFGYGTTSSGITEVLQLTNAGHIGIGASPSYKLDIQDSTASNWYGLRLLSTAPVTQGFSGISLEKGPGYGGIVAGYLHQATGSGLQILTNNGGTVVEVARAISNGSSFLIGYTTTNNTAYKLQVNSQIFATSSSIATSDGRYKENVDTITSGLDIVDSLRPVSFTWKDHPVHNFVAGKTVGFIAQEVKEALSEYDWVDNIIKTNTSDAILDEEGNEVTPSEEFLGIAESNIIPLLVAAVKELKARVETLEANNV